MSKMTLIDLLIRRKEKWKKYFKNPIHFAEIIKKTVLKHDKNAKVILFGSVVKGVIRPDSDIDVLIVTDLAQDTVKRIKLKTEVMKILGDDTPFEVHIVTADEYENWFRKFLDRYVEI